MGPDPDAALMLAFQQGDEGAFRTLYERHARAMFSLCHSFVRDQARAEELAQDVFVNLYRARDRYRPTARFKTFLYRIGANHCLNALRRAEFSGGAAPGGEAPTDPDGLPSGAAGPEEMVRAKALESAFQRLLARLPERQRAALVLCRLEGLSYEEIAQVLEVTVPAVKSLVHRATVAAAEALAPFEPRLAERVPS
ncbi:MAG TPA: RNA polymerase sigma factor [Anaeromyxobacter sp.]|nr:RNA polymerase sigma factor [Anaeromyxobacter sp.]